MKLTVIEPSVNQSEHLETMLRHYLNTNHDSSIVETYPDFEAYMEQFYPEDDTFIFIDADTLSETPMERFVECIDRSNDMRVVILHDKDYLKPTHEAFRFLERPISIESFNELLDSELMDYYTDTRKVDFEVGKNKYDILMDDILFVNIEDHQTVIHKVDGENIPLRMTFGRFLDLLNFDPRFMICNRNLVINMDKIKDINEEQVTLQDDTIIPLRRNIQKKITEPMDGIQREK